MGTPSNQDPNSYGGYSGSTPPSQPPYNPDDPYGATLQSPSSGGYEQSYGGQQQQQQQQQQYQSSTSYQPPRSAVERQQAYGQTSTGMSARKAAIWSYALGPLSGIYFLFRERQNRFVRFSAAQSTLFSLAVLAFIVILGLLKSLPVLGFIIGLFGCVFNIVVVALVLVWIFLMLQAWRGVKFKIPYIGDFAERLSGTRGQP
ncbi:hypothetical protein KSC_049870 [Ktedonobacter sp. SOSP1-52]|uniref:DUF4870 domain-containing protein n=1 Tax=Ktedonobacter sp. SOSP1-52 TaxID=2778366 RepID=UPI001915EE16|nr:DUF4870 domain-containing protein [Ktedonobacter sp. SOSP1-52]GHO66095.1 hypothetical protein KSC_049870 [Ktedonobacter sp. SOSP1-52]